MDPYPAKTAVSDPDTVNDLFFLVSGVGKSVIAWFVSGMKSFV
jgi:hypothetical protein